MHVSVGVRTDRPPASPGGFPLNRTSPHCPPHQYTQVGASNELPESEELDALYDRFLIRRNVAQVSSAQLATLARLAAGTLDAADRMSSDAPANGGGAAGQLAELTMDDFRRGGWGAGVGQAARAACLSMQEEAAMAAPEPALPPPLPTLCTGAPPPRLTRAWMCLSL
jgi:hypothetical protein